MFSSFKNFLTFKSEKYKAIIKKVIAAKTTTKTIEIGKRIELNGIKSKFVNTHSAIERISNIELIIVGANLPILIFYSPCRLFCLRALLIVRS